MTSLHTSTKKSLAQLLSQTSLDDHEEVARAADAALKKSAKDYNAKHVKVVALLKLERYDEVYQLFLDSDQSFKDLACFEYAYVLYKYEKGTSPVNALSFLPKVNLNTPLDRRLVHVEAQYSYRQERFDRAASLYDILQDNPQHTDNPSDIRINRSAVDAQLLWSENGDSVRTARPSREDLEAFETAYNAACISIARGDISQGVVLLQRANDCCKASDDLSDEERTIELQSILAQRIYASLKLNKDVSSLVSELSISLIPDRVSRQASLQNAMIAAGSVANPFLAHRQFVCGDGHNAEMNPTDASNQRWPGPGPPPAEPFKYQEKAFDQNHHVLELQCHLYGLTTIVASMRLGATGTALNSKAPEWLYGTLMVAAKAARQPSKKPLDAVIPLLEKHPKIIGLHLLAIQLYLRSGDTSSALRVLEGFLSQSADEAVTHNPGLIALLVTIYSKRNQKSHILQVLARASTYWEEQPHPPYSALRAACIELLTSTSPSHHALSSRIFTKLLDQDSSDRIARLGHIAENAANFETNSSDLKALPDLSRQIGNIDAAQLEADGVAKPPTSLPDPKANLSLKRAASSAAAQPRKKRLRKSRMPKDYNPAKKPDPERWLPIRERSSYKPKGKKGKAKAAALTQGGVTNEESLELAGGAGSVKVEKAGQGGKVSGKNKKKGKRK